MTNRSRSIAIGACYCILHLGSDLLTRGLEGGPLVPIRHTPGLALALLALGGVGYAPVVFGCFLISAIFFRHPESLLAVRIATALIQTVIFAGTAFLVRRRLGPAPLPHNRADTAYLISAALLAAALNSASITGLLYGVGSVSNATVWANLTFRWAYYTASILMVAPAIAIFVAPRLGLAPAIPVDQRPRPRGETAAQVAALLGSLAVAFSFSARQQYHLSEICFAPLAWIALTRGLPGATLATLTINLSGYCVLGIEHASPPVVGELGVVA